MCQHFYLTCVEIRFCCSYYSSFNVCLHYFATGKFPLAPVSSRHFCHVAVLDLALLNDANERGRGGGEGVLAKCCFCNNVTGQISFAHALSTNKFCHNCGFVV